MLAFHRPRLTECPDPVVHVVFKFLHGPKTINAHRAQKVSRPQPDARLCERLGLAQGLYIAIAVRDSGCRHIILRTAWVYAARGQNFLRTALRLAAEREELRIVNDQVGCPTPARWLASLTALMLVRSVDQDRDRDATRSGTWHAVASGACSWHEFATAIYAEASAADWDAARACRFSIRDRATKRFIGAKFICSPWWMA